MLSTDEHESCNRDEIFSPQSRAPLPEKTMRNVSRLCSPTAPLHSPPLRFSFCTSPHAISEPLARGRCLSPANRSSAGGWQGSLRPAEAATCRLWQRKATPRPARSCLQERLPLLSPTESQKEEKAKYSRCFQQTLMWVFKILNNL